MSKTAEVFEVFEESIVNHTPMCELIDDDGIRKYFDLQCTEDEEQSQEVRKDEEVNNFGTRRWFKQKGFARSYNGEYDGMERE